MAVESVSPSPTNDDDVERLSEQLKRQVALAKDRISDRYGKLMEARSFESKPPPRAKVSDS
jgi:hypothetical protein